MKRELADQIIQDCPILFRDLKFIEAPDGWFELIRATSKNLENIACLRKENGYDPEEDMIIKAEQIKSKFGGLRFYVSNDDDHTYPIINFAERLSVKLCEECGESGKIRSGGWIFTLCERHHIEHQDSVERSKKGK